MTPTPAGSSGSKKSDRGVLYAIGGVLLAVLLTCFWFSDSLGAVFTKKPDAKNLEGTWIFDRERAKDLMIQSMGSAQQLPYQEQTYGRRVYTFAPGTLTIDNGSGGGEPMPCTIEGYPPNAYLVTKTVGKPPHELVFQFENRNGERTLYLSADGTMIPFKPR